jgi:hypothetical protein
MRSVATSARTKFFDVIRDHALQPRNTIVSRKFNEAESVEFGNGSRFSGRSVVFPKHSFIICSLNFDGAVQVYTDVS